jgi:hypothetical protein
MGLCASCACPLNSLSFWLSALTWCQSPVCLLVHLPIPFAYLPKVRCKGGCWRVPHWLDVGFHMSLCTSLASPPNFLSFGIGCSNSVYLKIGFLFFLFLFSFYICECACVCLVHGKRSYFSSS